MDAISIPFAASISQVCLYMHWGIGLQEKVVQYFSLLFVAPHVYQDRFVKFVGIV